MTVWRYILHADLDAFYASVEQHDNPALRGVPVAVGGPPESRGVVAAASYEARRHGVRSAMPMRTAFRLCPELVRVSARFDRYREVSQAVMGIFHSLTPLVEPLSMDEAYMDVSAHVPPEQMEETGRDLKKRVRDVTGLAVTIGGGTSKSVAKIASQQAKPDGLLLVPPGTEEAFLAPLEVSMLWGVGPVTTAMLNRAGVRTIADLAARDESWLRRALGARGLELQRRARGQDHDPVVPSRETKSVSAETTLPQDISYAPTLQTELARLSRRVVERLQAADLRGRTVSVKLRLADFTTFTRQSTLDAPTSDPATIAAAADMLLLREIAPGRRFRLLGVGVSNFAEVLQQPLFPAP